MIEYFQKKVGVVLRDILKNKNLLKKIIIILLGIILLTSLSFNFILCDKMIRKAYQYEDNMLEISPVIVDAISGSEIQEALAKINTDANGKFTGERINGKKEGEGTYIWNDGSVYQGNFSNDLMNGEGLLTIPGKGSYEGNFVNSKKSGKGTYKFANGDTYTGSWDNDAMSGYGTYTFSNGDKYVGQFVNNQFHGKGTYTSDGNKFTGTWINNQYQK